MNGNPASLVQPVDWLALGPPLVTAMAALALLVAEVTLPRTRRSRSALGLGAFAACLAALALAVPLLGQQRATFCVAGGDAVLPACSYVVDRFTLAAWAVVLLPAAVVVLLALRTVDEDRLPAGEHWFLLLCSVTGALTLAAARDVLTLVVALEVVSLPAFALVGLPAARAGKPAAGGAARASEAALKFFLVTVVSTALTLYGISLVYGVTGAVHLERIATALALPEAELPLATVGVVLTVAGFAVKVAAVPFHFWAPDTYTGAPVPVAAYLSVVSKAAGFAGLLLVLAGAFPPYVDQWAPVLAVLAAATMTVGNLVALRQHHAVRLLAWSSVAQSGYILVPLGAAAGGVREAVSASLAYLLAYAVMNLAAFAVVVLVARRRTGDELDDYRGLARSEPLSAAVLLFALACLAGLPPGLLGLVAKVVVFAEPVERGPGWLAVVMAVNVVIALYYYLAWAALIFSRPLEGQPAVSYRFSVPEGLAIGLTGGAAVGFSLLPGALLDALGRGSPLLG